MEKRIPDKKPERVIHEEIYAVQAGKDEIKVTYYRYEFRGKSPQAFVNIEINEKRFDAIRNCAVLEKEILRNPKRIKAFLDYLPNYVLDEIPEISNIHPS